MPLRTIMHAPAGRCITRIACANWGTSARRAGGGRTSGKKASRGKKEEKVDVISPGYIDTDKFERSKRIGWFNFDLITKAKVLVVGAGALGNEVIKNLVLSGYRKISLVDMDHVVYSNLNRCVFFRESDS